MLTIHQAEKVVLSKTEGKPNRRHGVFLDPASGVETGGYVAWSEGGERSAITYRLPDISQEGMDRALKDVGLV